MADPRIVPREEHVISRRAIDPDALRVLYRLRQGDHMAYLVGGSVRDLLLGRRPKDFDVGTSAHPYQVKKLFRNCWIIGRRFRLAHVKFGTKVIEVATFRRQVAAGEEVVADGVPAPDPSTTEGQHLIHRDNTFGTPEEDAFRRDFTINALFYDIATFSVIDYVSGLEDLRGSIVRSIGDPDLRLREDPVRMLRAIALAARLRFVIEPTLLAAIRTHRQEIAKSSAPRVLEEYYKILRAGSAEEAFRSLAAVGLLEPTSPELDKLYKGAADPLWRSLVALDTYRRGFESTPETLTNAILLGTLLVPLAGGQDQLTRLSRSEESDAGVLPRLGDLPLARKDVERLRQILQMQRRLHDLSASPRAQRAIVHRHIFREALTWLGIHGNAPELVEHWKRLVPEAGTAATADHGAEEAGAEGQPFRRRRRRRRRRKRYGGMREEG
jgi:poly(A) polymerase